MPETKNQNTTNGPDNNSNTQTEEQKINEPQKVYTISEDLETIKNRDIISDISIKLQYGKHPKKEIDELISRRFKVSIYEVKSNILLRIFITISSIFFIGIAIYGLIWIINASITDNMWFAKAMSPILGFLTLSGMAIAIFIPFPVIDENKLTLIVNEEIKKLEEQAGSEINE